MPAGLHTGDTVTARNPTCGRARQSNSDPRWPASHLTGHRVRSEHTATVRADDTNA